MHNQYLTLESRHYRAWAKNSPTGALCIFLQSDEAKDIAGKTRAKLLGEPYQNFKKEAAITELNRHGKVF